MVFTSDFEAIEGGDVRAYAADGKRTATHRFSTGPLSWLQMLRALGSGWLARPRNCLMYERLSQERMELVALLEAESH